MASSLLPAEICVELDDNGPEDRSHDKEERGKSTLDPHLISTTTGGMENSCHNCLLGFGIVTVLIGISTISVLYASDPRDLALSIVGHTVLFLGIACIVFSCAWRYYRTKTKAKMVEDTAELFYENKLKKIKI